MSLLLFAAAMLFGMACSDSTLAAPFPNGLDRVAVEALVADVRAGRYGDVRSLILTHGDDPSVEYYFGGARRESLVPVYSVTKSVTALLTGIAIARGALIDTQQPISMFFPAHVEAFADERRGRIRIEDLLTMRAGMSWNEIVPPYTSPANVFNAMVASPDWIATLVAQPMANEPGSNYVYNSGASVLLGHRLQRPQVWRCRPLRGPSCLIRCNWVPAIGTSVRRASPIAAAVSRCGRSISPRSVNSCGMAGASAAEK